MEENHACCVHADNGLPITTVGIVQPRAVDIEHYGKILDVFCSYPGVHAFGGSATDDKGIRFSMTDEDRERYYFRDESDGRGILRLRKPELVRPTS